MITCPKCKVGLQTLWLLPLTPGQQHRDWIPHPWGRLRELIPPTISAHFTRDQQGSSCPQCVSCWAELLRKTTLWDLLRFYFPSHNVGVAHPEGSRNVQEVLLHPPRPGPARQGPHHCLCLVLSMTPQRPEDKSSSPYEVNWPPQDHTYVKPVQQFHPTAK